VCRRSATVGAPGLGIIGASSAGGRKRLLLEFECQPEGLDKTGLNAFIDALKKERDKMER